MFSKFLVSIKLCKYCNFRNNWLNSLLKSEYSYNSITSNRGFFTLQQNSLFIIPQKKDNKNHACFNIAYKMSSNNKKGNGQTTEINNDAKELVERPEKNIFSRVKSKRTHIKKPHMNCTRCKTNKKESLIKKSLKTHAFLKKNTKSPYTSKKGNKNLKEQVLDLNRNQDVLHYQLPQKRVHVEFMESQNLKDFNLNKSQPELTAHNSNSANQNVITKYTEPHNSTKVQLNPKVQPVDNEKALIILKAQYLNKPKADVQNKQIVKVTDTKILLPERNTLHKAFLNEGLTKTENIRILYQAHPMKKIKVRIPKRERKSRKMLQTKAIQQLEPKENTAIENKNLLLSERIKVAKNIAENNKTEIKMLKPKEKEKTPKLMVTQQQKQKTYSPILEKYADSKGTSSTKKPTNKIVGEVNEVSEIYCEYLYVLEKIKSTTPINTSINTVGNVTLPKIKLTINPNKQVLSTVEQLIQFNENIKSAEEKSYINSTKPSVELESLEFLFGKYILPEKQIDALTKLEISDPVPKKTTVRQKGAAILKTNKLTKSKKSRKSGGGRGSSRGGGGSKNIEKIEPTKARRSKFWPTLLITMLPLMLGLTIYAVSNMGAVEIFKRMRYARSSEVPLSVKILPAFHEQNSETQQLNLKEAASEVVDETENEEEYNSTTNETEDEKKTNYFSFPY